MLYKAKKVVNSKDDIKKFVESSEGSKILIDKNDLLIVYVKTFKDLKSLASDTSWCILNEYTWELIQREDINILCMISQEMNLTPNLK